MITFLLVIHFQKFCETNSIFETEKTHLNCRLFMFNPLTFFDKRKLLIILSPLLFHSLLSFCFGCLYVFQSLLLSVLCLSLRLFHFFIQYYLHYIFIPFFYVCFLCLLVSFCLPIYCYVYL